MRREASDRGFALVTALWAIMILSVIVGIVLMTTRTEARLVRNRRELAELDAIADAAINIALLRLTGSPIEARPPVDSTPFVIDFGGKAIRLSVQDETGKIDLNHASGDTLIRLLVSAGLDAPAAAALADKIMDWREPGIGKRLNGAKGDDYEAAGYAYGPRNGSFESVEELKLVLGIGRALFDKIAPDLTVYAQVSDVNPEIAPAGVLRTMPGMDEDRLAIILQQRARWLTAGTDGSNSAGQSPLTLQTADWSGRAFSIIAQVQGRDLMEARRIAVIRLSGIQSAPLWIYRWQ